MALYFQKCWCASTLDGFHMVEKQISRPGCVWPAGWGRQHRVLRLARPAEYTPGEPGTSSRVLVLRKNSTLSILSETLKRDAAFPGNKIVLRQGFCLGARLAAGNLNHSVKDRFAHFLDGRLAGDDSARIDINNVRHALGEI